MLVWLVKMWVKAEFSTFSLFVSKTKPKLSKYPHKNHCNREQKKKQKNKKKQKIWNQMKSLVFFLLLFPFNCFYFILVTHFLVIFIKKKKNKRIKNNTMKYFPRTSISLCSAFNSFLFLDYSTLIPLYSIL